MSAPELKAARERVLKECAEEVRAVLDKHGCEIVALPFIDGEGRTRARVELTVKKE